MRFHQPCEWIMLINNLLIFKRIYRPQLTQIDSKMNERYLIVWRFSLQRSNCPTNNIFRFAAFCFQELYLRKTLPSRWCTRLLYGIYTNLTVQTTWLYVIYWRRSPIREVNILYTIKSKQLKWQLFIWTSHITCEYKCKLLFRFNTIRKKVSRYLPLMLATTESQVFGIMIMWKNVKVLKKDP